MTKWEPPEGSTPPNYPKIIGGCLLLAVVVYLVVAFFWWIDFVNH